MSKPMVKALALLALQPMAFGYSFDKVGYDMVAFHDFFSDSQSSWFAMRQFLDAWFLLGVLFQQGDCQPEVSPGVELGIWTD